MFLCPEHESKPNERKDGNAGMHKHIKAGKVEEIDKVDICHTQLILRQLVDRV
jgi:hypothetical protein